MNCQSCQIQEGQFICTSVECVKPQDNKLICFKCYIDQHAQNEISKHKPLTQNDLLNSAIEKSKEYIKFQEQCQQDNQQLQQLYEQDLDSIFNKIIQWHGNQKKLLQVQIEQANSILINNINKAKRILEQPTIDLLLFFHLNINEQTQKAYERKKQIFNRNREQEVIQLEYKVEQLIKRNLEFTNVLNLEKTNQQLNSNIPQQVNIIKCQEHKKKKSLFVFILIVQVNRNNNFIVRYVLILTIPAMNLNNL